MHSGLYRDLLAYRCGGSAGMAAMRDVTGFPFQPDGQGRRIT
jgi:hypothetical protein